MVDTYNHKYHYNREYFKEINTPEKAYWIGFILGDGHLSKLRNSIIFHLASKDKQQLYNFIDEIDGDYTQIKRNYNKYDITSLCITSKQMIQDLINIGIPYKNKSFTAKPLEIPYINAFWLGIFDADGSVGIYGQKSKYKNKIYKYNRFQTRMIGTKSICTAFSKFLGYNGEYVYNKINVWQFNKQSQSSPLLIYQKLYKYNILCLQRKKEIFERWMGEFQK